MTLLLLLVAEKWRVYGPRVRPSACCLGSSHQESQEKECDEKRARARASLCVYFPALSFLPSFLPFAFENESESLEHLQHGTRGTDDADDDTSSRLFLQQQADRKCTLAALRGLIDHFGIDTTPSTRTRHRLNSTRATRKTQDASMSKASIGKSVRWSTVTVYEFGVAIGGSAIPKRGGPAIGLAKKPEFVWSTRVEEVDGSDSEEQEESDDSTSNASGDEEQKAPAVAAATTTASSAGAGNDRSKRLARKRRVRWLKPLERVTMLEQAGCSEKRIYRTMMESSEIAMSRRLCISVQRSVRV